MKQSTSYFRLGSAIILILLEALLLSLLVDARTLPESGIISVLLAKAGHVLRWVIVSAGLLVLFLANGFQHRLQPLVSTQTKRATFTSFIIHLGLFFGFAFVTLYVFRPQVVTPQIYHYLWLVLAILTALSWSFIIASGRNWKTFITTEYKSIVGAIFGGVLVVALGFYFQQFWGAMTELTLYSAKTLLALFYDEIIFDPSHRNLGINSFWVNIAPVCSGIEGAVLAVSIASFYLYLARHYLQFPHALVLIPLAIVISITLNIVRIAALIIIGAEVSPALAVGGFHSVAGWISAIFIALMIVFVFSHWNWIQCTQEKETKTATRYKDSDLAQAILIPFVASASISLVGKVFFESFDYAYPIKVVITLSIVLYFWKKYNFRKPDKLPEAVIVGVLVAVSWVLMSPSDEQLNNNISAALFAMPLWALIGWSAFRLLGFWVLAPILEELVFRGYLLSRLSGQEISNTRKPMFSLFALVASSVLFGLLHNAWLVGTIAGLLFAYVRYRSHSITSCIVAHSTANVLVAGWAIHNRNWALF